MFACGLGDWNQSQVESYQTLKIWYLMLHSPFHLGVEVNKKSPSITIANFYYFDTSEITIIIMIKTIMFVFYLMAYQPSQVI